MQIELAATIYSSVVSTLDIYSNDMNIYFFIGPAAPMKKPIKTMDRMTPCPSSPPGHSMSNHPMVETVPPQILMKIYTFGLYGQKRRFAK